MQQNKYSKLPHISLLEYYQFVTFRTHDSVDDFIKRTRDEDIPNNQKEYKIDNYLDNSFQGCYLNNEIIEYLRNFLINKNTDLYDLVAFCIMPNHIHILFKQKVELPNIMKSIKGSSSITINKLLNKKGKFWDTGYYDKLIRDEKHFDVVYEYIKNNAIKADLRDWEDRFYGIYE